MRYYFDTNILAFILFDKRLEDNCDKNVREIVSDYENRFYISTIAIRELIKLYHDGELESIKFKSMNDIFLLLEEYNIEIKPFTKQHVITYGKLSLMADHKDPNDHMIIAQSISDKIPLISSDKKFILYENQGLQLVFNKR